MGAKRHHRRARGDKRSKRTRWSPYERRRRRTPDDKEQFGTHTKHRSALDIFYGLMLAGEALLFLVEKVLWQ